MDNKRRKVLHKVLDELDRLSTVIKKEIALEILEKSQKDIEFCMDEEEAKIDARGERLAWTSLTMDMQENLSDLTNANGDLECAIEDCKKMSQYDYSVIRKDITLVVHAITRAIYR